MIVPKKIVVIGGTHGNEWTGIYAIQKYASSFVSHFKNLDLHFVFANPEAYKLNRRFKDEDLNRAFQYLQEERPDSYEQGRAKELKSLIDESQCFVIDLHTTTSNMGNTVIITRNQPINFYVAKMLTNKLKNTRIIVSPDPNRKYLVSQSDFGFMIEVGPVPNGVIDAKTLQNTVALLKETLDSLSTPPNLTEGSVEIYEEIEDVFYPQTEEGELLACIHEEFQGKDFAPVEGEYVPFRAFTGEEVQMNTKEKLYPIFINEAAYYPARLAFTLCRKRDQAF